MPRTVFLDLYGVLADSIAMNEDYNRRMAETFVRRFGGDPGAWRTIQAASFAWYQEEGRKLDARPGNEREGEAWVRAVEDLNAGQIAWMFRRADRPIPPDALQLAEEMEAEVVCSIDALYPDVKPSLRALKGAGHRIFLSTNANRSNGESALIGGGVRDVFDGVVVLEVAKAKKDRSSYWERAFTFAHADPRDSIVVDDVPRFLDTAASLGAVCVQMIRPEQEGGTRGSFPVVDSMGALCGLLERP